MDQPARPDAERVSHYRLIAPIARGSMGQVYRAVDERLGRAVALKLLLPSVAGSADRQARLLREAQAASSLNHVGIVTIHDIGAWQGRVFLVMELVDGEPLTEVAARGVAVDEALRLCALAADALGAAHERGIFHRDIKSANLMRTRDGGLKVLDFGLAKRHGVVAEEVAAPPPPPPPREPTSGLDETLPTSSDVAEPAGQIVHPAFASAEGEALSAEAVRRATHPSAITRAGDLLGTPAYMAPELIAGGAVSARSEIFGLGVVLYELLVGKRPFDRPTVQETARAICREDPVPPAEAAPGRGISAAVDGLVLSALARAPGARPADMRSFAAALRACITPPPRPRGRRRWIAAGVLALGGAAGLLALTRGGDAAPGVVVRSSRRVTFDVGCEEYPSFTPDGKSIVYDSAIDGDYELIALDLETGLRRRLTHRPGWDYGGVVSPDGTHVAYVHMSDTGRELRVLPIAGDQAGPAHQLGIAFGFFAWGATGLHACTPDGAVMRWQVGAAGPSGERFATLPRGLLARSLAALGDGRVFAIWQAGQVIDLADAVLGELPAAGEPRALDRDVSLEEAGLALSPSQRGLYYLRRSSSQIEQLVRHDIASGTTTTVPGNIAPRSGFDISADGRRLAYSTCGEANYLARVRPGVAAPEPLTPRGAWRDVDPVTLGSDRVLLTSNRSGSEQVMVLALADRQVRPLAPLGSYNAAPVPGGKEVVFAQRGQGLVVARADGSAPRPLTDDASDKDPTVTRDGKLVVFQRTRGEGIQLYRVPLAGGEARPLTARNGQQPALSPVEDRLVYLELTGGGAVLMLADLDGKSARLPGLPDGDYMHPRFSPDGKRILLVRKRTELVEVAVDGSTAPRVLWKTDSDGIYAADYAPDGDGWVASIATWEGDLWIAEGEFP